MPAAPLVSTTVTATSYATDPDVVVTFDATDITVWNTSTVAADVVYVSFDGVNDNWILTPGTPTAAISMQLRHTKVWYKLGATAGNTTVVYMGGAR